jgi:hypothetical protein
VFRVCHQFDERIYRIEDQTPLQSAIGMIFILAAMQEAGMICILAAMQEAIEEFFRWSLEAVI